MYTPGKAITFGYVKISITRYRKRTHAFCGKFDFGVYKQYNRENFEILFGYYDAADKCAEGPPDSTKIQF
jgi:hypothetical protein